MIDSDEEFESINEKGPNPVVQMFMAELPEHLREKTVPLTYFTKVKLLANGSFGRVYHVTTPDKTSVALKKLSLQQSDNRRHAIVVKDSLREAEVLASLKHKNIAQLHYIAFGISDVYFAIELCPVQLAKVAKRRPSERIVKSIMWQLMTGLSYIHSKGLIHRDIKTDNLMLNGGVLKIADFGSTAGVNQAKWTPQVVTLWYRPPEILLCSPRQTCAIDIWSAGCVMAELFRGPLFCGISEINQINSIVELLGTPTEDDWPDMNTLPVMNCMELQKRDRSFEKVLSPVMSRSSLNFLAGLLMYDPAKRLSSDECLRSAYFTEEPIMAMENEVKEYCEQIQRTHKQWMLQLSRGMGSNGNNNEDGEEQQSEDVGCDRTRKRLRL